MDEKMQDAAGVVLQFADGTTEHLQFFDAPLLKTVDLFRIEYPVIYELANTFGVKNLKNRTVTVSHRDVQHLDRYRGVQDLYYSSQYLEDTDVMRIFLTGNPIADAEMLIATAFRVGHPRAPVYLHNLVEVSPSRTG